MQTIFIALLPIFLLIFIGYLLKRVGFPSLEFWQYADKFTYYVLFPSLLIYKLSTASLDNVDGVAFVSTAVIALIVMSIILMIVSKFLFLFENRAFTSVYQGTIRFNTYVFLALITAIFGDKGIVLAAFLITFMIPIINIFCISIFAIYSNSEEVSGESIFKSIFKNPLILACIIGGGLNFFDISLYVPIEKTLSIFSIFALPLGLLSVGIGLHIKHIKEVKLELVTSLFLKLALLPAIMFFMALEFEIGYMQLVILTLFASMPTAPSSYILARQLSGDVKLMSTIITMQTLFSIFTISVILMVLDIS
ncbi:MAG: AEC family transporter [Campylobacterota bacterium]